MCITIPSQNPDQSTRHQGGGGGLAGKICRTQTFGKQAEKSSYLLFYSAVTLIHDIV